MDELLFKRLSMAAFGGWVLAMGVGASHLAVEALFPQFEAAPVDARPLDLRDAPAAPFPQAAAPDPGSGPPGHAAARAEPADLNDPATRATSPSSEAPEPPYAPEFAAAGPVGRLAGATHGSAPAGATGAFADFAPRTAEPKERREAPHARASVPSRGPIREGALGSTPVASELSEPAEPRVGAAEPQPPSGRLASAHAPLDLGKAIAFPDAGARLIFQPSQVQSSGGRLGQGSVSMEAGRGATFRDFDPRAKGLGLVKPELPPGPVPPTRGPVLRAGNAPAIPSAQLPIIVSAAREAGIDPALLAATAARESNFSEKAYRAEPHLTQVLWGKTPGVPKERYFDGSIGPTQVLRSNFIARGIDNDKEAFDLRNNYRVSAGIIRSNLQAFPGNEWKAVAAYNVGQYGAKLGWVPAGGYTDTVLAWRKAYAQALEPYR